MKTHERIKQLAFEAGLYYSPHGTCCMDEIFPRHFNPQEADEAYAKFAELIVKECINEVHATDVGDLKAKSYYLDKVAEHLEKYFGVEE